MRVRNRVHGLWLCGLLAACAVGPTVPSRLEAPALPPPEPRPSQLYARDGTPVGAAAAQALPQAGTAESGRMYLLELYQRAVEERDALALQVDALLAEGDKLRRALAASEEALARQAAEAARQEAERERLVGENVELAGRLVTAQIRRLQAEKMLLEHRLAPGPGAPAGAPATETPAAEEAPIPPAAVPVEARKP